MIPYRFPNEESERINLLNKIKIVNCPPSKQLDRITRLTAEYFNVPAAFVTLIDRDKQWFKSCFGLSINVIARKDSICNYAITQNSVVVIPDLRKDSRFSHIPQVINTPHLVFYAGCQICSRQGIALGTLCIIDTKPHAFSEREKDILADFANLAEHYFHSLEERTYTKAIEENLSNSESMFAQTFSQAAVGMANVSLSGKWIRVNPTLCEMLGYSETELLTKSFQEITHPDDLKTDLNLIQQLLDGKMETYSLEKRYIDKQGRAFWILLTVSLVKNNQHQPHHFIAVIVDINEKITAKNALKQLTDELEMRVISRTQQLETALKRATEETEQRIETENLLNLEKDRLKNITDNVPALISCADHQLRFTFTNKTYETWFGIPAEHMRGKHLITVIGEACFNDVKDYFAQVIKGQKARFQSMLSTQEGLKYVQTMLIPNQQSEQEEFYILSLDITELKQLQDSLLFEASHDVLTGLPNRRSFITTLNNTLHNKAQFPWLALLFIDLDGFKSLNDSYGHEFGDMVLKTIADTMRIFINNNTFAARLAGDEFTFLVQLTQEPHETVEKLCQSLLQMMAEIRQIDAIPVQLSLSIGVALEKNQDGLLPEKLLAKADKAMYLAKLAGKGQFHIER